MQHLFPLPEIIEGLIKQLSENYIYPEKVPEIAACLHQYLDRDLYDDVHDGETLAQMITEHLRTVGQDKHLRLIYQADGVPNRLYGNEVYTPEEIERISQLKRENYGLKQECRREHLRYACGTLVTSW